MIKVMIVDDNVIIHEAIRTAFPWAEYDMEIAASFFDGESALRYLEDNKVDLVISDVEMPVMNGIELLNSLRKNGNNVKFLFISCYDEFQFIKSAMDMDAVGYILKPIIEQELKDAILKVLDIYQTDKKIETNQNLLQSITQAYVPLLSEKFFRNLLLGTNFNTGEINTTANLLGIDLSKKHNIQLLIIKLISDSKTNNVDILAAQSLIHNFIQKYLSNDLFVQSTMLDDDRIAMVFIADRTNPFDLTDIFAEIKDYCLSELKIKTIFVMSSVSDNIQDCHSLMLQTEKTIDDYFFLKDDRFILYNDIGSSEAFFSIDIKKIELEINNLLLKKKDSMVSEFLSKYIILEADNKNTSYIRYISYTIINILDIVATSFGINMKDIISHTVILKKMDELNSITNIRQFILDIFQRIFETMNSNHSANNILVQQIKEIIKNEYKNHLTISYIAEKLSYSNNHINNVFQEEMKISIFDYLTNFRMEKAKEMLSEPGGKIYVIANNVGYKNQAHFKILFKQYTGMTPVEFKKLHSAD